MVHVKSSDQTTSPADRSCKVRQLLKIVILLLHPSLEQRVESMHNLFNIMLEELDKTTDPKAPKHILTRMQVKYLH